MEPPPDYDEGDEPSMGEPKSNDLGMRPMSGNVINPMQPFEYKNIHKDARDGNGTEMHGILQSCKEKEKVDVKKEVNSSDNKDRQPTKEKGKVDVTKIVNSKDSKGRMPAAPPEIQELNDQHGIGNHSDENQENSVPLSLPEKKSKVNEQDENGDTPLHHAIIRGNIVAAEELLNEEKIDITIKGDHNVTPLQLAILHGEEKIIEMLMIKNAGLEENKEWGILLNLACSSGCLEIVKRLLEGKPDSEQLVKESNKPLVMAVKTGNHQIAEVLIQRGADVNKTGENGLSPLHFAAKNGDLDIVILLINNEAIIDAADAYEETPLHKAAAFGQGDIVKYLLSEGADLKKRNKDNFSPFLLAATNGHQKTMKTLIEKGATISDLNNNNENAALLAAKKDHLEVLKVLLKEGAQKLMNTCNSDGDTPLHVAARNGHIKCVEALVEQRAPLDTRNHSKQIPLHCAAQQGKSNVVWLFLENNRSIMNYGDVELKTALHYAAEWGHHIVAEVLISTGADVDASTVDEITPLHCAAVHGWTKIVELLLDADANFNKQNVYEDTPLLLAAASGHVQCVNILLDKNADVTAVDREGDNCLDCAVAFDHKEVAMAIVKSEKWKEALRKTSKSDDNQTSPLVKLICKFPDVAKEVFDRCIHEDNQNKKMIFRYEFLDDSYIKFSSEKNKESDESKLEGELKSGCLVPYTEVFPKRKNNHPLMIMLRNGQEDLLAHSLVNSLINHKWTKFGRYAYYLNLVVYSIYVGFLTVYVGFARAPFSYTYYKGEYRSNLTECTAIKEFYENAGDPIEKHLACTIGMYAVSILGVINIIREVWQWNLTALSIFLAWIHLVLFIRKMTCFGIYVAMFKDVLWSFIKFVPLLSMFIIAFAMAFYCLIQNQIAFADPWISILRTFVMMIGEIDFSDTVFGDVDEEEGTPSYYSKTLYYRVATYICYVLFFILMSIIMMNLLIGVAVGDIQAIREKAQIKAVGTRINLVLDMERILPKRFTQRFVVKYYEEEQIKQNKDKFPKGISKSMKSKFILQNQKETDIQRLEGKLDHIFTEMSKEKNETSEKSNSMKYSKLVIPPFKKSVQQKSVKHLKRSDSFSHGSPKSSGTISYGSPKSSGTISYGSPKKLGTTSDDSLMISGMALLTDIQRLEGKVDQILIEMSKEKNETSEKSNSMKYANLVIPQFQKSVQQKSVKHLKRSDSFKKLGTTSDGQLKKLGTISKDAHERSSSF